MSRDKSIDIAKGLLILFVIAGHTRVYNISNGVDFSNTYLLANFSKLFNGFYMQAFFFITGYVSNFAKEKSKYHSDNVRTILLPLVFLSIIVSLSKTLKQGDFAHLEHSLLYVSINYWFVIALFLSKTFYYYIHKYNTRIKLSAALICYVLGFVLWKYTPVPNLWYFEHAMLLTPFLIVGDLLKSRPLTMRHYLYSVAAYVGLFGLSALVGIDNPVIAHHIHLSWDNLLFGIPFTFAGIFSLLGLCRWINSCCLLEYIGRNSLIIYILHMDLLLTLVRKLLPYIDDYPYLVCLSEFVAATALCLVAAFLINTRYGKWILGKF